MYMMNDTVPATATAFNDVYFEKMTDRQIYKFNTTYDTVKTYVRNKLDQEIQTYMNLCNQYKLESITLRQELQGLNKEHHRKRYNWIKRRLGGLEDLIQRRTKHLYSLIIDRETSSQLVKCIKRQFRTTDIYTECLEQGLISFSF